MTRGLRVRSAPRDERMGGRVHALSESAADEVAAYKGDAQSKAAPTSMRAWRANVSPPSGANGGCR